MARITTLPHIAGSLDIPPLSARHPLRKDSGFMASSTICTPTATLNRLFKSVGKPGGSKGFGFGHTFIQLLCCPMQVDGNFSLHQSTRVPGSKGMANAAPLDQVRSMHSHTTPAARSTVQAPVSGGALHQLSPSARKTEQGVRKRIVEECGALNAGRFAVGTAKPSTAHRSGDEVLVEEGAADAYLVDTTDVPAVGVSLTRGNIGSEDTKTKPPPARIRKAARRALEKAELARRESGGEASTSGRDSMEPTEQPQWKAHLEGRETKQSVGEREYLDLGKRVR